MESEVCTIFGAIFQKNNTKLGTKVNVQSDKKLQQIKIMKADRNYKNKIQEKAN